MTAIYVARGLSSDLARQVALQLHAGDALAAHARDELGITDLTAARPVQAALTSAATFSVGAGLPLAVVLFAPMSAMVPTVSASALVFLALLGWVGARTGGAKPIRAVLRVTFWGAFALAVTALVGMAFGAVV